MQGEIFGFWEDPSEARALIWKNQRNLPGCSVFGMPMRQKPGMGRPEISGEMYVRT